MYDGRVYTLIEPVIPAATNARDQLHPISDQVVSTIFCRLYIKISLDKFLKSPD